MPDAHEDTVVDVDLVVAWVTHYGCDEGWGITASGVECRPGMAAGYAVRGSDGRIMAAEIAGQVMLFGSKVYVEGIGEVEVQDTGMGFEDGRAWLDIAMPTTRSAVDAGARWRKVRRR